MVSYGRYVTFQMAKVAVLKDLFQDIAADRGIEGKIQPGVGRVEGGRHETHGRGGP